MGFPDSWKCKNCKSRNYNTRKCLKCGFTYPMHYPELWQCPNCNSLVEHSKKCFNCNYPKNLHYPELWQCPYCHRLIKSSGKCPHCKPSNVKKQKELHFKVSKAVIIPLAFLTIIFIIIISALNVNVPVQEVKKQSIYVFNTSSTSLSFPTWSLVKQSDTYVKLYDEQSYQSIYYFVNEPYFSTVKKDLYNVYSNIGRNFDLTVEKEYTHGEWEVICFSNELFYTCLSATLCDEKVSYLQFTNYALDFNNSLFFNIMDSFCCNC